MEELRKAIDDYENKYGKEPVFVYVSQSFFHSLEVSMSLVNIKTETEPFERKLCGLHVGINTQMEEDFRLK